MNLVVDSKGLHSSMSTEHAPRDPFMNEDVAILREANYAKEISRISWIPGVFNPADPLTKPHSGVTSDLLFSMLSEGIL